MSISNYLRIILFSAFIAWITASYIVFFKSPEDGKMVIHIFLFSFGVGLWLTSSLLVFWIKYKWSRSRILAYPLGSSLRQGAFITLFTVGLMALKLYDLLNPFDTVALAVTLVMAESFFKAKFDKGRFKRSEG